LDKGFTFIEVLVALVITVVLILTLFQSLKTTIRVKEEDEEFTHLLFLGGKILTLVLSGENLSSVEEEDYQGEIRREEREREWVEVGIEVRGEKGNELFLETGVFSPP